MARVEIPNAVLGKRGDVVSGASVLVNIRGGGAATIYESETGGTTKTNPLTTDAAGRIEGWVSEGSYDLIVSGAGFVTYTFRFEATRGRQRDDIALSGTGLIAQTFDPQNTNSVLLMTTQRVLYHLLGLKGGDLISNFHIIVTTGGSGLTLVRLGLYSKQGILLAQSADVDADMTSGGRKVVPVSTPHYVTQDDGYYVAVLAVGTTPPTFLRGGGGITNIGEGSPGGLRLWGQQDSQSDLPASFSLSNTGLCPPWIGLN